MKILFIMVLILLSAGLSLGYDKYTMHPSINEEALKASRIDLTWSSKNGHHI